MDKFTKWRHFINSRKT